MVPELHRLYSKRNSEEEKLINPQTKVLSDILALLEVDRIFMKSFNSRIMKFIMDHRDSIDLFL